MRKQSLRDPSVEELGEFLGDLAEHGYGNWTTAEEIEWRNHCVRVLAERFPKMCKKLDELDAWEGT